MPMQWIFMIYCGQPIRLSLACLSTYCSSSFLVREANYSKNYGLSVRLLSGPGLIPGGSAHHFNKLLSCPGKPAHNGADGNIQHCGRIPVGIPLKADQGEHGFVLLG